LIEINEYTKALKTHIKTEKMAFLSNGDFHKRTEKTVG